MDDHYEPALNGNGDGARTRRMKRRAAEEEKTAASKKKKRAKGTIPTKITRKGGQALNSKAHPSRRSVPVPNARVVSGLETRALRSSSKEPERGARPANTANATVDTLDSMTPADQIRAILRGNKVSDEVAYKLTACLGTSKADNAEQKLSNGCVREPVGNEEECEGVNDEAHRSEADPSDYDEDDFDRKELDEEEVEDVDDFEDVEDTGRAELRMKRIEESDEEHDLSVTVERESTGGSTRDGAHLTDSVRDRATAPAPRDVPSISSRPGPHTPRCVETEQDEQNEPKRLDHLDETVLAHVVDKVKEAINDRVQKAVDEIYKKLDSDLERVHKIGDYVMDLTNVVSTAASVMFIKQANSVPRQKEIHSKICILPALFTDSFILKIMSRSILGTAWKEWKEQRDAQTLRSLQRTGIDLLSIMFFSRQPSEKAKEKFASVAGKKFSKFRNGVLLMSFMAMQKNSFGTFRKDLSLHQSQTIGESMGQTGETRDSLCAIFQPFWLQSGFIRTEHCLAAAAKFEKRSFSDSDATDSVADSDVTDTNEDHGLDVKQKQTKTGPITREEIAVEASCLVYKIITAVLHRSRVAGKVELFQGLLYLFTGWAQYDAPVKQESLKMKWDDVAWPSSTLMDSLPKTHTIEGKNIARSNDLNVQQMDLENMKLLEKLISSHPQLSLLVEHDVIVEGTPRVLNYRINMIEVGSRFFTSYVSSDSHAKVNDALNVEENAFTLILLIAIGLHRLLQKAVHDSKEKDAVLWTNNTMSRGKRGRPKKQTLTDSTILVEERGKYTFEDLNGLSVNTLMPPPSKQKDLLLQMILNISKEQYLSKQQEKLTAFGLEASTPAGSSIQVDDSLNIFNIV